MIDSIRPIDSGEGCDHQRNSLDRCRLSNIEEDLGSSFGDEDIRILGHDGVHLDLLDSPELPVVVDQPLVGVPHGLDESVEEDLHKGNQLRENQPDRSF